MARANYTYRIEHHSGRNIILIEDEGVTEMSVTNDIESVVEEIASKERIHPGSYIILYKDSAEKWDGWDHANQDFVVLLCDTWKEALKMYITEQLK